MTGSRGGVITAAVLLGAVLVGTAPALGFEIFGIRLWGEARDADQIEIIDPLPYSVDFAVAGGDADLEQALQRASSLWSDRDTPASGKAGLLAKSRGDYRRILAALYNAGFYGGAISIRAAGVEVADLSLAADLPPEVPIEIAVDPGPPFVFGRTDIVNPPPVASNIEDRVEDEVSDAFAPGEPARAGVVGAAADLAVERWRQVSYAKAREAGRDVIADHPQSQLDVTITLDPGRPARYGPLRVEGSRRIEPEFTAFMTGLREGERFDPDEIDEAQARLARLGVFRSIRLEEAETLGPDGSLPITVRVEDRRPRTLGFGGTLSTIDGLGVQAYWLHRNLLGRAEQLRFDASIDGLGQSADPNEYDYSVGVSFTKPGVYTPDTSAIAGLVARQLDFDTYRERSVTARAGVSQLFGSRLTGEVFAEVSAARFEDEFGSRDFLTFALVTRAEYDRRNDTLEPTGGYFLAAEVRPFYEIEFGNPGLRSTVEGRIYRGFGEDDRFVLAARALVGSFNGPSVAESPPDQLFFAGGGGSVRGYGYRSIGVEVASTDSGDETAIVGGRGLVEGSAELRVRLSERFGAVAFVDAGFVSENARLGGDSGTRIGAGLGFRYYTGIGALRADVAVPIDPRRQDDAAALYIGIGQSF